MKYLIIAFIFVGCVEPRLPKKSVPIKYTCASDNYLYARGSGGAVLLKDKHGNRIKCETTLKTRG